MINIDKDQPNKVIDGLPKELEQLMKSIGVLFCIGLLLYFTKPDYLYHQTVLSKELSENTGLGSELIGDRQKDEGIRNFIDGLVDKFYDFDLYLRDFTVKDKLFFTVGYIKIAYRNNSKWKPITFGILGKVFVKGIHF